MKINKKILVLLTCISACISLTFISTTYAKYLTSANGLASVPVARWNIKINNQNIKNNSDFSSTLSPVFPGNDNIASNIIAPTSEGYVDLDLDFSGADVSFIYEIAVSPNVNSSVPDLISYGYSVDNENIIPLSKNSDKISDKIIYSDNIKSRYIRIYLKWDDSADTSSMNNLDDTITTLNSSTALVDISVSFKQVTE